MTLFNSKQSSHQTSSSSPVAPRARRKRERKLSLSEKIGIASLFVTTVAIPISLTIPEIRCGLHLQSESCPGSIAKRAEDFYQKGSDLLRLERNSEALDSFNQAIELDRKQAQFWNSRGDVLKKLGENQQAVLSYEQALLLDPSYELARQNREALLQKLSKKPS